MNELSPEAVRVLVRTRELLQQGWCRNVAAKAGRKYVSCYHANADRFCLMGAYFRAVQEIGVPDEARLLVHWMTREARTLGMDTTSLEEWNDAPGRTQEDVLRLLDGILARARK